MTQIIIDKLTIDIQEGPIGVALSGGADSSLLFYILMKYAKGPIYVFSCANGKTNFQEPVNALKVVNKVKQLLPRDDVYFNVHWADDKQVTTAFPKVVMDKFNLDVMYFGFTRPPPANAFDFSKEDAAAVGGVDTGDFLPTFWEHKGKLTKLFGPNVAKFGYDKSFHTPFININKQGIASMYASLEIDDLYSITRSCESLSVVDAQCGKCWWCKERIWAFGKLE